MSRVSVKTSAFTNTVGTFPSSDFTDLNGFDGQVRVQAAGFCHNGFGNVAHARAIGTFLANQYAAIKVTGMTGAPDSVDQIGVSLRLGTGVRGAAGVTGYSVRLLDAGTQTLKVYKVVADVETVLGTLSTPTFVNGDVLSAEATGTSTVTFAVYQNATLLSNSITDTTSTLTSGSPGLCDASAADVVRGSVFDSGNISVDTPVNPGAGNIALTGYAPTVSQTANQVVAPGAGNIVLTGYPPAVSQGGSSPQNAFPGVGSIAITGYAPKVTVAAAGPQNITPGIGSVFISGFAPTVTRTTVGSLTSPFPLKNDTATTLAGLAALTATVCSATGVFVVTKAGLPTDINGFLTFSDALIVGGVTYCVLIVDPAGTAVGCFRAQAV